jgi:drug/metabolite transporter (DMT)-like permease
MLPHLNSLNLGKHKKTHTHTAAAHLCFLIATLIWSAAGPIIKVTLQDVPPTTFLFLRFLVVCILVLPYAVLQLSKTKVYKSDYFKLFLLGFFSQTCIWLAFWALKFTSALDYTIISLSGTIISIYAGYYFFNDKVTKGMIYGLILASFGTLLVTVEPIFAGIASNTPITTRLLGNIIAVVFNLTWVLYIVGSKIALGDKSTKLKEILKRFKFKPMRGKYPATLIVIISFFVGLATMIPLLFLEIQGVFGPYTFNIFDIGQQAVLGILYMAILSSIVAYIVYLWGLENAHISESAIYGYMSPVFTLPFAYALLGEVPNTWMLIGGAFITLGVVIAERENT